MIFFKGTTTRLVYNQLRKEQMNKGPSLLVYALNSTAEYTRVVTT